MIANFDPIAGLEWVLHYTIWGSLTALARRTGAPDPPWLGHGASGLLWVGLAESGPSDTLDPHGPRGNSPEMMPFTTKVLPHPLKVPR